MLAMVSYRIRMAHCSLGQQTLLMTAAYIGRLGADAATTDVICAVGGM